MIETLGDDIENSTKRTPTSNAKLVKALTPSRVFQEAKTLFRRSSTPSKIIGRDNERKTIEGFIQTHVLKQKPGALYISGCPGGGKTALVEEVLRALNEDDLKGVRFVQLNAMSAKEPKMIFPAIYQKLTSSDDFLTSKEAIEELTEMFVRKKKTEKTM